MYDIVVGILRLIGLLGLLPQLLLLLPMLSLNMFGLRFQGWIDFQLRSDGLHLLHYRRARLPLQPFRRAVYNSCPTMRNTCICLVYASTQQPPPPRKYPMLRTPFGRGGRNSTAVSTRSTWLRRVGGTRGRQVSSLPGPLGW